MNIIHGDLIKLALDGEFDIIIHGCNCFCTMGKGIAKTIKNEFPEAYRSDLATIKGDKSKLGKVSIATINRNSIQFDVINGYTQFKYGGNRNNVNYDAIKSVFKFIKNNYSSERIGYPLIGAGLASGDWKIISEIINKILVDENHTLVKYKR